MLLFFFVWSGIGCFLDFLISSSFDTSFFVFFVLSKKKSREEFFVCVTRKTTPLANCTPIEFYISIAKKSSDPPKSR